MKFSKNLPQHQVPEWSSQYINYKGLKKLIKDGQESQKHGLKPDLAGFFYTLDRNLEDVDHFYSKKQQDLSRRLKLLDERYGSDREAVHSLDEDEREDILQVLVDLREQFRKLEGFGIVNRQGFRKITKKLDKKIEGTSAQKKYLALKVDPKPFASNVGIVEELSHINAWVALLTEPADSSKQASGPPSIHKLSRSSSKQALRVANDTWLQLVQAVKKDDARALMQSLSDAIAELQEVTESQRQQLLKSLLQKAISARSRACVHELLQRIVYLDDSEDLNKRNCIHRLVISIGRAHASIDHSSADATAAPDSDLRNYFTPAMSPASAFKRHIQQDDKHTVSLTRGDEPIVFLIYILESLTEDQRTALISRDTAGRTPLHAAAEYGVKIMVEIIVEYLKSWQMFETSAPADSTVFQDDEGWAPIHLSALKGHPVTTQALLDAESSTTHLHLRTTPKSNAVLGIATASNYVEVVRVLVRGGFDINAQNEQGETALHIAARFDHAECAEILLQGSPIQKANTELQEKTYGWTPLFIACTDGRSAIVELLIKAGTDLDRIDFEGVSTIEHAAIRGYIDIADRLSALCAASKLTPILPAKSTTSASSSPPKCGALTDRNSTWAANVNGSVTKSIETVKEFGHRYLTDRSMILVSLGTMDMRKNAQAVNLDRIPMADASSTQLDTALSVIVSAKGAEGEAEIIDLPVQDNISTEPIVFHAVDLSKVKLYFDLVPTYAGNRNRKIARGVAVLSSIRSSIGDKRTLLQGDLSVPLMTATDMEVIGSVTFNFLVIKPFTHPKMGISKDQTYWKKIASTMVIGHRGLGKNLAGGRRSLQLGENTIDSFVAAANLGAQYVEFDVQLTKDLVPVIYHDFLVSETGIDAPVHTLTLEQFLHVNEAAPRISRPPSPIRFPSHILRETKSNDSADFRGRSLSVGGPYSFETSYMDERMKHTRDFKKKGFKGNTRGNHIQSSFATLEDLFKKLPTDIGFNIEMKYPMYSESQDEDMDAYAVELNSFVDTILTKVYDLSNGRNVIFSSFHPDICLMLSFKQPSIPVLFLTDAGTSPVGDIRASSLQEAIRFAARWNLLGIVSACQPLVVAPRLIRVVKESGLVCMSYGMMNNDRDKVKIQVDQGIDAVIVDSVLNIRLGLREEAAKAERALAATALQTQTQEQSRPTVDSKVSIVSTASSDNTRVESASEGSESIGDSHVDSPRLMTL